MTYSAFKRAVWAYYKTSRRSFPWRETVTPYGVVVSEVMLQQTQAPRVIRKYESFMERFPNFQTLAEAPLSSVLKEWQGLGYNRRGLAMKKLAQTVMEKHGGELPRNPDDLLALPNIGKNTVGSVSAFAFNIPLPFIETNVRSVFIHCFFKGKKNVHDKDILPLVEKTLDRENPREWYWALMDYGVMLKKEHGNPSRKSKHHVKQKPFKGSNREVRSRMLKLILGKSGITEKELVSELMRDKTLKTKPETVKKNLADFVKEGFAKKKGKGYAIAS
jgi:A/G-specific adenine glycosylase